MYFIYSVLFYCYLNIVKMFTTVKTDISGRPINLQKICQLVIIGLVSEYICRGPGVAF